MTHLPIAKVKLLRFPLRKLWMVFLFSEVLLLTTSQLLGDRWRPNPTHEQAPILLPPHSFILSSPVILFSPPKPISPALTDTFSELLPSNIFCHQSHQMSVLWSNVLEFFLPAIQTFQFIYLSEKLMLCQQRSYFWHLGFFWRFNYTAMEIVA